MRRDGCAVVHDIDETLEAPPKADFPLQLAADGVHTVVGAPQRTPTSLTGCGNGLSDTPSCIMLNQHSSWCVVGKWSLLHREAHPMKTIIQMSEAEEAKALPLLLRHSPGTILPKRIYVISAEAAKKLREAGVQFTELSRESTTPRPV